MSNTKLKQSSQEKKILSQISLNLPNTCNLEKLLLPENFMKRKLRVQEHSGIFGTPFSGFVPVYCINTKKEKKTSTPYA